MPAKASYVLLKAQNLPTAIQITYLRRDVILRALKNFATRFAQVGEELRRVSGETDHRFSVWEFRQTNEAVNRNRQQNVFCTQNNIPKQKKYI